MWALPTIPTMSPVTITPPWKKLLSSWLIPAWTLWLWLWALLAGLAFGMPLLAFSSTLKEDKGQFALVQRFIVMPLFLFSGTFFPLESLPGAIRWIGWISPLWHSTELGRILSYGYAEAPALTAVHVAYLLLLGFAGWVLARRNFTRRLGK